MFCCALKALGFVVELPMLFKCLGFVIQMTIYVVLVSRISFVLCLYVITGSL